MRPGYASSSILLAILLTLSATPAHSGRLTSDPEPLRATPRLTVVGQRVGASMVACPLGITDLPGFSMNYLYPPDDAYYTLLTPATCGCVGSTQLTTARIMLDFSDACGIPVSVGVVSADLSDPSCPVPQAGDYGCEPLEYDLVPTEPGVFEFEVPLASACAITDRAFLMVKFLDLDACGSVPSLVVTSDILPCTSWNDWPGGMMTDLTGYLLGNPNMSVVSGCGSVVPATARTWGSLKTIYR